MKKIKSLIIMILISGAVLGQTTTIVDYSPNKHNLSLGFLAGYTTGVGVSLKKTLESQKYSFSVTLTPPFFRDGKITYSSLGLTGYYNFNSSDNSRVFSYLSVAGFYKDKEICDYHDVYPYYCTPSYKVDAKIHTGIGLGFEIVVYEVSFQLMVGYRVNAGTLQTPSTKLSIETGIAYYLK